VFPFAVLIRAFLVRAVLDRSAVALLAGLLAAVAAMPAGAQDQEAKPVYDVRIEAPGNLDELLRDALDIVRWRTYAGITPELIGRLAVQAEAQAYEAVATEGYYAPRISVTTEERGGRIQVLVKVEPGEPTRVAAIDIRFRGAVVDENNAARVAAVHESWPLQVGAVFRQADWALAKRRAVDTLSAVRYASAGIVASHADVDPATGAARLSVELDSGPPFYFGPVTVLGLSRYTERDVVNYSPFRRGDEYTREEMEVFQRRLIATNYFASTQIVLNEDRSQSGEAPVTVSVIEAPSRRLELGVGYSTDTFARASIVWRDVDVRSDAWRWRSEARIEQTRQTLATFLDLPARANGWGDQFDARLEHSDIQNLATTGVITGYQYRRLEERDRLGFGAQLHYERSAPEGAESDTAHAVYAYVDQTWRFTDDLLSPRRGLMLNVQAGAGLPGVSSRTFGRAIARAQYFLPVGRRADLSLRAEAGAVAAGSSNGIPESLLFRTGGDLTVRGYAYQSLGVSEGEAIVGGRYYALTSAEYTHWFAESWGVAAFVDAGDAADTPRDLSLAVGYGLGVRVRSPIGPFRLDVAYGERTEAFRIHFSVGLAF
jgi:translocation and assembly module TamA